MATESRGCFSILLAAKPLTGFASANRDLVVVTIQEAPRGACLETAVHLAASRSSLSCSPYHALPQCRRTDSPRDQGCSHAPRTSIDTPKKTLSYDKRGNFVFRNQFYVYDFLSEWWATLNGLIPCTLPTSLATSHLRWPSPTHESLSAMMPSIPYLRINNTRQGSQTESNFKH